MSPTFDWALAALPVLACASLVVWRIAPPARRRVRFVCALLVTTVLLRLCEMLPAAPRWIRESEIAFEELIVLHLVVIVVFHVALSRFRAPRILSDLAIGAGYVAVFLTTLTRVGVNLTGIIATSAVATAVIGFGLQDILGNLASGLVLEMEQGIASGQWIRTDQYLGQVRTVRMRYTALETPDGDTVLAPNSALVRSPVLVYGAPHRKLVTFQLPYGHNPPEVIRAVDEALSSSPLDGIAAEPKPRCVVVEFHPQHVQYGALVWIMRPGLEYLDLSGVRTRISFALGRIGAPLVSIPYLLDHRHETAPQEDAETAAAMAALRGIEFFRNFEETELRPLAANMKSQSFAPGEAILKQGEPGDSAYIVKRGSVQILLSNGSGLSGEVARAGPGDFFGEMSLLTGENRTATVKALDQVDCYRLSKPDLDPVFAARPELAEHISAMLAERHAGLESVREKLDGEAERQREAQSRKDLLSRIRRYFALS